MIASLLATGLFAQVPIITEITPTPGDPPTLRLPGDAAPYHVAGTAASVVAGHAAGQSAIRFGKEGAKAATLPKIPLLDRVGESFTVTAWVKADAYPTNGHGAGLVAKRNSNMASPFVLSIGKSGELGFEGYNGVDWSASVFGPPKSIPRGEWAHVALAFKSGDAARLFVNGKQVASRKAGRAMAGNDLPLVIGGDAQRGPFDGAIGRVAIYAATLTGDQLAADRGGTLETRPAKPEDFAAPQHLVELALGRYDMPRPFTNGFARTRLDAARAPGPDAVDWPRIYLKDRVLFGGGPIEKIDFPLRDGPAARPFFQQPGDEVLHPGGHWFRPLQWLWGRRYVYQADSTARSDENRYELWVFPVKIAGDIQSVRLSCEGRELYDRKEPLRSLTLLLPQNAEGKPYELSVNDKPAVTFDAGLEPIRPGDPKERVRAIDLKVPGTSITITDARRPATFAYADEWAKDLADARQVPEPPAADEKSEDALAGRRWLDSGARRSPIELYTLALPHGMSGGHFMRSEHKSHGRNANDDPKQRFEGGVNDYAEFLARTGYDTVYEMAGNNAFDRQGDRSYDALADALASRGLRFGITPGVEWKRPFLAHPNLAFFTLNLPDYRAPLYRDVQLIAQRMGRHGNFAGISIGADNAAYESFWAWAPPEPGRPWAEAFRTFAAGGGVEQPTDPLTWPEPASLGGKATAKAFVDYIHRYDKGFEAYGYFDAAMREVHPSFTAITGSFGSSPGVGGRGGYPWATIPARSLFANLSVMQTYDWNEVASSKPLHNVALIDRVKSYYPDKPLRALIDDFGLFFGREARQRAYALALTRGVDAIGTSFLASPYNAQARVTDEQRELYTQIKSLGGAYAGTRPEATIGVLYVNEQALFRKPNQEADPKDEALFDGSHEGKTTEALILCHAAGWPAKIVTPEELRRGLPASMKAVLLVGLNREDPTWAWSDGLEDALAKFVAAGGRVLRDEQSAAPGRTVDTGIKVRSYIAQGAGTAGEGDRMPQILERNADNIARLRAAMKDVAPPVATSADPTIWAVPHVTGDVRYVTVANWGYEPGKNASHVVKPQTAELTWHAKGDVYDVAAGQRLTPDAARRIDLTKDGARLLAIPSKTPTKPTITAGRDARGRATVRVDVAGLRGVPVRLEATLNGHAETFAAASGADVLLPVTAADTGACKVVATELLSGLSGEATIDVAAAAPTAAADDVAASIRAFVARRDVPLTVALTPEQAADPRLKAAADKLAAWLTSAGRRVELGSVEPNGVVLSLQPLLGSQSRPRWRTVSHDLVLLGGPRDNVLVFDQVAGGLIDGVAPGARVTHSPFVGERHALNVIAADAAGVIAEIERLTGPAPSAAPR